jgi:hypothetical protein
VTDPTAYRFDPLDHSGVLFGLPLGSCLALAVALTAAVLGLTAGLPLGLAALPLIVTAALVVPGPFGGPLIARVPPPGAWWRTRPNRRAWRADLAATSPWSDLPECLQGLAPAGTVGVHDRHAGTTTIVLRLFGPRLALRAAADHDLALGLWGDVLNQLAADPDVVSLAWSDHLTPANAAECAPGGSEIAELVRRSASTHECLLSLTLHNVDGTDPARATRLAAAAYQALTAAGIAAEPLLEPQHLEAWISRRAEPHAPRPGRPLALERHWTHCRIDGAVHRALWIANWPHLPVTAGWLDRFLAHTGVTRTLALASIPTSTHHARRQIERDLVKLESDALSRAERGRRVAARHRRNTRTLLDREEELVEGHAEYAYTGIVVVTADTVERLDHDTAAVVQRGLEVGLELRPLHGRHDLGWAAALPLGLVPRMVRP